MGLPLSHLRSGAADRQHLIQEEALCEVTLFNGVPLAVTPPNFVEMVIKKRQVCHVNVSANMLASLLYMIAPKFRPGRDQFGRLDDNVQKIVWLFELLGQDSSVEGRQAIQRLRQIRVMRLYSESLDRAEQAQAEDR